MKSKHDPSNLVNNERNAFLASSGGVGPNKSSRLPLLIYFAANLMRYSGFSLSPLFVSTRFAPTGALPVIL